MAEMSFPLENTDYGAEEAQLWFSGRTSGVFASDELAVSTSEGMRILLGEGRAWMAYTKFAGVVYANTVALPITVPTADAYFDRIDRVVLRFDRTGNTIKALIISGTPSSTPSVPTITRDDSTFELSVAQIRVKAGTTEITAADITDERLDPSVCGLMEDGATGIDTSVYYAQWQELMRRINDAMSGAGLSPLTAYPVGSIYMSTKSTSPAELFGGTWEQIKDMFLLSAGDTYAAGSTGGEAEKTLTAGNLAAHQHTAGESYVFIKGVDGAVSRKRVASSSSTSDPITIMVDAVSDLIVNNGNTGTVGDAEPFSIMPPYLAVYVWKRLADDVVIEEEEEVIG